MVIGRCGHAGSGSAPSDDEESHERASGNTDEDVGRQGLPCELGDGVNRTGKRILVANQAEIFRQSKDIACRVSASSGGDRID